MLQSDNHDNGGGGGGGGGNGGGGEAVNGSDALRIAWWVAFSSPPAAAD